MFDAKKLKKNEKEIRELSTADVRWNVYYKVLCI
jgi:hypothetical protein